MNNIAVIIPEYNEANLEERLDVFNELGKQLDGHATVVVVDDASTNGNRERLARYVAEKKPAFQPYFMETNGRKVGAIKSAVKSLPENVDTVVLTDIDSRLITTPENLELIRNDLQTSNKLVGGTLRLKVANPKGLLGVLQNLEYEVGRIMTRFLHPEGKSFCVSGASAVYKRDALEKLLEQHSGRHNGDDKELTALAMKNGGQLRYWDSSEVETTVPSTLKALFKQRSRWDMGQLETYVKEFPFYVKQIATALKGRRFGFMTGLEIYGAISFPLGAYFLARTLSEGNVENLVRYYLSDVTFTTAWLLYGRKEIENKLATALAVPLIPIYRVGFLVPARAAGYIKFASEVANDTTLSLYIAQGNLSRTIGEKMNRVGETATSLTKRATASIVTPLLNLFA